jgi:hypothetical protein
MAEYAQWSAGFSTDVDMNADNAMSALIIENASLLEKNKALTAELAKVRGEALMEAVQSVNVDILEKNIALNAAMKKASPGAQMKEALLALQGVVAELTQVKELAERQTTALMAEAAYTSIMFKSDHENAQLTAENAAMKKASGAQMKETLRALHGVVAELAQAKELTQRHHTLLLTDNAYTRIMLKANRENAELTAENEKFRAQVEELQRENFRLRRSQP